MHDSVLVYQRSMPLTVPHGSSVMGTSAPASVSVSHPFKLHAPNSFFQLWMYSLHQSSLHTVSAQPHVFSILHTTILYRSYSSSVHATPSRPPLATMPRLRSSLASPDVGSPAKTASNTSIPVSVCIVQG